ncbi:hypothetical protein GWP40_08595 [Treponema vincentii]|uniref:hypothetical protein n=1 Tax=Treponema vincentii TaxID=69710 RepID=UPI001BB0D768|nr:hypothetical protein [Treponema vincentii]QUY18366.1 hypothetical protein GWP40_08595 [Treponema vincentii]
MERKIIIFDEYFELVKDFFSQYNLTEKERDVYLQSNEVQQEIKEKYEDGIQRYKKGMISYDVLTTGTVESVCYNLWLEY